MANPTGEIIAEFNTRDHRGHKAATIKVRFDKPFPAEVQLQVTGFIRTDVVLQPGAIAKPSTRPEVTY